MGRIAYAAHRLIGDAFSATINAILAMLWMLVPPYADGGPRFDIELFQDVLHVLLHGARAALKNFADLAIAFASGDPFHDLVLALSQGRRLGRSACSGRRFAGLAGAGGHGNLVLI